MTELPANESKNKLSRHVFKPSLRFLFDWLLLLNSFLFALMATKVVENNSLLAVGTGINLFLILTWVLIIQPLMQVEIKAGGITGPSDLFIRKSFLLRKVDVRRTLEYNRKKEFWGYRDLWSVDGEHIRLYRRFLGKSAHYQIIKLIKEPPFHESAPPPALGSAKQ